MPKTGKETSADSTVPAADSTHPLAFRSISAVTVFLLIAAAGLAGDLLSKHCAFISLLADPSVRSRLEELTESYGSTPPATSEVLAQLHVQRQLVPGVQLTLSTNPGVVFGTPMYSPLISVATGLTAVLVGVFFATSPARARWTHVALALIVAGALGNLYDRLFSEVVLGGLEPIRGQVRDFVDCSQLGYKWIFNLADAYLVVGVAILVVRWFGDGRRHAKRRKSAAES